MNTESSSPKKQRKSFHNASLHDRRKRLGAHLSEALQKKLKKRSESVRKNDLVKITRGRFRKRQGKVTRVDYQKLRVYVEGLSRKKAGGKEVPLWVNPSNLLILELSERKSPIAPSAPKGGKA